MSVHSFLARDLYRENRKLRGKLKTYRRLLRLQTIIKGNINARLEKEYRYAWGEGFDAATNRYADF